MSNWAKRAAYLKSRERCVRCGKQDAYTMSSHQHCYECTVKARERQSEYNKNHREEINQKSRERREKLKSQGICITCGKKKATFGEKCAECRARFNEYQRRRLKERCNDSTGTC